MSILIMIDPQPPVQDMSLKVERGNQEPQQIVDLYGYAEFLEKCRANFPKIRDTGTQIVHVTSGDSIHEDYEELIDRQADQVFSTDNISLNTCEGLLLGFMRTKDENGGSLSDFLAPQADEQKYLGGGRASSMICTAWFFGGHAPIVNDLTTASSRAAKTGLLKSALAVNTAVMYGMEDFLGELKRSKDTPKTAFEFFGL